MPSLSDIVSFRQGVKLKRTVPANFGFLISHELMTSAFFANVDTGKDIRISTDVSGNNTLPVDIGSLNKTGKRANLWISSQTTLVSGSYLYLWCNPRADTITSASSNIWTNELHASHDFSNERAGQVTLTLTGGTSVSGPFALTRAINFNTGGPTRCETNHTSVNNNFSLRLWIYRTGNGTGGEGRLFSRGNGTVDFYKEKNRERYVAKFNTITENVSIRPTGIWHHFAVVNNKIYNNGVPFASVNGTFSGLSGQFRWGNNHRRNRNFSGYLAEPRFSRNTLTSAWIALEYYNVANQLGFASVVDAGVSVNTSLASQYGLYGNRSDVI